MSTRKGMVRAIAHFFGSVQGQAAAATRLGSKKSGIHAYVQTNEARISIDMGHSAEHGTDRTWIALEGGRTTYGGAWYLPSFNAANVFAAVNTKDEKITRIMRRIEEDLRKLDAEAPKAIKREARRKEAEKRAQEQARKERLERERAFAQTITDAEAAHFVSLLGLDEVGIEPEEAKLRAARECCDPEHNPYRNRDGHLIVRNGFDSLRMRTLNLTEGIDITEMEEVA